MEAFKLTPKSILALFFLILFNPIYGQQKIGAGSYATSFPGYDSAGRNAFPNGNPQLTKTALGKPVPTNDWWSKLVKENHAGNLFNYPLTMKTTDNGLIVTYIPFGVIGDNKAIEVGVVDLKANKTTVSNYSDWTVTMNWKDGVHEMDITSGIGMPFLYFEKNTNAVASIQVNHGTVSIDNEILIIENASYEADFVVYAPSGSSWTKNGNNYTSGLNGKNYWSMAMLPQETTNTAQAAESLKKYAYVFPKSTTTSWNYSQETSVLSTTFNIETEIKEGNFSNILQGLLPHQWSNLSNHSAQPEEKSYQSIRGELKMLAGNTFTVDYTFRGILPTLPYLANYSEGFDPTQLDQKIEQIENDGLATWTDSYNEGQMMNRMIQTARIAEQTGNTEAFNKMIKTIKDRLEDWLSYQTGEVAFLFYYNKPWSALLGYPSGHGQDNNINDHHFHWGYFIHAAAFLEQFEPGWANQWGDMINLLIRDAASADRNDNLFPFLRNFSPYAGHSWANGFASFPQGNDQESTSESMQFASSLIHWGSITNQKDIRDLGIYIYTTEQAAIEEYWFDINQRVFNPGHPYKLVSRVWGNSYDNGTFWVQDIAASYGIELYPIHGGSLYLGHNKIYAQELWTDMTANTGILNNQENPNLWHDTYWKFLALTDATTAIKLYDSYPNRNLKFGVSDAQTYHWIHNMNALGTVDTNITANHPLAVAFTDDNQSTTYVAQNYQNSPLTVTFSDGYTLDVPPNKLATNRDIEIEGVLKTDFNQAYIGGSVNLNYTSTNNNINKVEFYNGTKIIDTDTNTPFQAKAKNLDLGIHKLYAKVYIGSKFAISNSVSIQVGEQIPYDTIHSIPGTIEAGKFDKFEGGLGQNICYFDSTTFNEGNTRKEEAPDTSIDNNEGMTVGWITPGEWLEYSINVQNSAYYEVNIRYASGNPNGGGPLHFEIDGKPIGGQTYFSTTNKWDNWANQTTQNIPLHKGKHVLRIVADGGEFNLGKITFTLSSPLAYDPPIAHAGENISITSTNNSISLDGSNSYTPSSKSLQYLWTQKFGPSQLDITNPTQLITSASNLTVGVYNCILTISDGTHTSKDEVLIIVSESGNALPFVSIKTPEDGASFTQGTPINISSISSDLDGRISKITYYAGEYLIGETYTAPYDMIWTNAPAGFHQITAKAFDDKGGETTSAPVEIQVSEVALCQINDKEASQGNFSKGYETTFETVGTNVKVTVTLLDNDKPGLVVYLLREDPFQESLMEQTSDKTFSKTIGGLSEGETISYAVKFAYTGGMVVTKYMQYTVGNNCNNNPSEIDTESPTNFSANLGQITSRSIEILLQANDNSGTVVYQVNYNLNSKIISGKSGNETSLVVNGLSPNTNYEFSISAEDNNKNKAANNPISIQASTIEENNSACSGTDSDASQGTFSTGYTYSFVTNGDSVTFNFELLDQDKSGVVAYLWRKSPFKETAMNGSGKNFSATISGFELGQNLSYACKFAYAEGMVVTKYLNYIVGEDCSDTEEELDTTAPSNFSASLGYIGISVLELLLYAEDNTETINYIVNFGSEEKTISGKSGVQTNLIIGNLEEGKAYRIIVIAEDSKQNQAENNPIVLDATTKENKNTACKGTELAASEGSFSLGYNYSFVTEDTNVVLTFELLDKDKTEITASIVNENPISELQMDKIGKTFTTTINGFKKGEAISYACKFSHKSGVSTTKYFNYRVGDTCLPEEQQPEKSDEIKIYPNPVKDFVYVNTKENKPFKIELYAINGKKIKLNKNNNNSINVNGLKPGLYLIKIVEENKSSYHKIIIE